MRTNIHLTFDGRCDEAFSFYETVFGTKRPMTMRWGEAAPEMPCPPGAEQRVMHTALEVGSMTLMGADAPPGRGRPIAGVDVSIDMADEVEVRRLYGALSEGGNASMPLAPTFWSPLFGMCTDRFGVSWMVSITGPEA